MPSELIVLEGVRITIRQNRLRKEVEVLPDRFDLELATDTVILKLDAAVWAWANQFLTDNPSWKVGGYSLRDGRPWDLDSD